MGTRPQLSVAEGMQSEVPTHYRAKAWPAADTSNVNEDAHVRIWGYPGNDRVEFVSLRARPDAALLQDARGGRRHARRRHADKRERSDWEGEERPDIKLVL
jgi:hypothetical protein